MSWINVLSLFRKDDLLTQSLQEAHQMLDLDLEMFEASVESLRRCDDGTVALDVHKMDKLVNRAERDVRRKIMTHLVVSGPSDLPSGLALVNVVIDLERIGDYATDIYDLARYHPKRLHGGPLETEIADIEARVADVFRRMARTFKESDVEAARGIMLEFKGKLAADCESMLQRLVAGDIAELPPGDAATLALYVRYLKRIGAHCRSVVSSLVNPFHRIGYKEKPDAGA